MRTGLAGVLSAGARYPDAIDQLERAASAAPEHDRLSLDAARSLLLVLAGQIDRARDAGRTSRRRRRAHRQRLRAVSRAADPGARGPRRGLRRRGGRARRNERSTSPPAAMPRWASYVVPHLWYGTALADADRFAEAAIELHAGRRRAEQTGNVSRAAAVPLGDRRAATEQRPMGRRARRGPGGAWPHRRYRAPGGRRVRPRHLRPRRPSPGRAERGPGGGRRGSPPARGRSGRDRLRVDELDRGAAAGGAAAGKHRPWPRSTETWDLIAPVRYLQATARAMGPDLVRMAKAAGDHQRAASVTEELEHSGPRAGTPTARGLALRCRGLLDDDVDALLAAVAAHREGPRPYQLAAACEDAGVALGRIARTNEAVALLGEATAIYERLHASWDLARVQAALRSLGVRRTRPRSSPHVRMGEPHPHRGARGRPRRRRAHQPRDRRAPVRVATHRRDPHGARVPEARSRQPCGARGRRRPPRR